MSLGNFAGPQRPARQRGRRRPTVSAGRSDTRVTGTRSKPLDIENRSQKRTATGGQCAATRGEEHCGDFRRDGPHNDEISRYRNDAPMILYPGHRWAVARPGAKKAPEPELGNHLRGNGLQRSIETGSSPGGLPSPSDVTQNIPPFQSRSGATPDMNGLGAPPRVYGSGTCRFELEVSCARRSDDADAISGVSVARTWPDQR